MVFYMMIPNRYQGYIGSPERTGCCKRIFTAKKTRAQGRPYRPVGYRSIKPMLPDFLDLKVNEIHIEMANREFAEIELLKIFAEKMDVAVGIIDVKLLH